MRQNIHYWLIGQHVVLVVLGLVMLVSLPNAIKAGNSIPIFKRVLAGVLFTGAGATLLYMDFFVWGQP